MQVRTERGRVHHSARCFNPLFIRGKMQDYPGEEAVQKFFHMGSFNPLFIRGKMQVLLVFLFLRFWTFVSIPYSSGEKCKPVLKFGQGDYAVEVFQSLIHQGKNASRR